MKGKKVKEEERVIIRLKKPWKWGKHNFEPDVILEVSKRMADKLIKDGIAVLEKGGTR